MTIFLIFVYLKNSYSAIRIIRFNKYSICAIHYFLFEIQNFPALADTIWAFECLCFTLGSPPPAPLPQYHMIFIFRQPRYLGNCAAGRAGPDACPTRDFLQLCFVIPYLKFPIFPLCLLFAACWVKMAGSCVPIHQEAALLPHPHPHLPSPNTARETSTSSPPLHLCL